jgi:hypothetical protein
MESFIIILVFAVATGLVMAKKGRSFGAGIVLGGLLPVIGLIIAMLLKPKGSVSTVEVVRTVADSTRAFVGRSNSTIDSTPKSDPTADEIENRQIHSIGSGLLIPDDGRYFQQVAGESYHVIEIKKLAKRYGGDGEHFVTASLTPEPTNKFDQNAIKVEIDGLLCGYIPKEETENLRPLVNLAQKQNRTLLAPAKLWSGKSVYDDEWIASVSLSIPWQIESVFPVNSVPEDALLWPRGGTIQVADEVSHLESISKILSLAYVQGMCSAFLELRIITSENGREVVHIFSNDEELGSLSAQSSKKFTPALAKLPAATKCFAYSTIRGNSLAMEITMDLLSPEKLSPDDLKRLGLS